MTGAETAAWGSGRLRSRAAGGLLALASLAAPAEAETLVTATSTNTVMINSNFTGTDITVFGTIERDTATVSRARGYDVAIVLTGPAETVVTRRKERSLGIWVNRANRTYPGVPSFYAALTTVPFAELADAAVLKRLQIGTPNLRFVERVAGGTEPVADDDEFRTAFLRLKTRAGLYTDYAGGTKFIASNLFRAVVPIPANVPVGRYHLRVALLSAGAPLTETAMELEVVKAGFEQEMADLSSHFPLVYGIGAVIVALFTGWIAGVVFRRD